MITLLAGGTVFLIDILTIASVLAIKQESTSAVAWCLLVLLVPFFGAFVFYLFGYNHLERRYKKQLTARNSSPGQPRVGKQFPDGFDPYWRSLADNHHYRNQLPMTTGNAVTFYHDVAAAYEAMFEAIAAAQHQIHLEFYIFRPDSIGQRFIDALVKQARKGIQVRLLYDAFGAHDLSRAFIRQLREAGGQCEAFLPLLNPLNRFRINLRNHRKILVVDRLIAFTGGLNIGNEYLGLSPKFGPWRDTWLQIVGPASDDLGHIFLDDWQSMTDEHGIECPVPVPRYTSEDAWVQVVQSGPDEEEKSIRQIYFAAIVRARHRIWLSSPYFVPDAPLREALCMAARNGIDVRILGPLRPDKWIPFLAARYYWREMLDANVKVYQYARGFLHSKMILIDQGFAAIGTANFDNRSLQLNFEVNCHLFSPPHLQQVEDQFLLDFAESVRIDPRCFAQRSRIAQFAENAARLVSPIL